MGIWGKKGKKKKRKKNNKGTDMNNSSENHTGESNYLKKKKNHGFKLE